MKSIFRSKTVWNSAATGFFALLASVTPILSGMLHRHFPERKADIEDVAKIVELALGAAATVTTYGAIVGRVEAGGVYTPDWAPGPHKPTEPPSPPPIVVAGELGEVTTVVHVSSLEPLADADEALKS